MSDLDQLRELGRQLPKPAFDDLLDTQRRRRRQARVTGASTLAVTAVVVAGHLGSSAWTDRSEPQPSGQPSSTTSPTPTPDGGPQVPVGQQTIVADVGPDDVRGFDELARLTSSQPEHAGDTQLTTTVATSNGTAFVEVYCRGGRDLYYFYDREDGASGYGSCSPDADTTLAPSSDIGDEVVTDTAVPLRMRMWLARPSSAYLDCFRQGTSDCNAEYGEPQAVVVPDAEFGFAVYEHRPAPVLHLFGRDYDAVSTIGGSAWLLDRDVLAAPGASTLVAELPASDQAHLVDTYQAPSPHFDKCVEQNRDELPDYETTQSADYWAAVDELCGVTLELVVDRSTVPRDGSEQRGHFTELGQRLSPGAAHTIEVRVVRGDPRNVRYALVVRTETPLPLGLR